MPARHPYKSTFKRDGRLMDDADAHRLWLFDHIGELEAIAEAAQKVAEVMGGCAEWCKAEVPWDALKDALEALNPQVQS